MPSELAGHVTIVDDTIPVSTEISDLDGVLPNLFDPLIANNRIMELHAHALEVTPVDESEILSLSVDTAPDVLLMGSDLVGTSKIKGIVSYSITS